MLAPSEIAPPWTERRDTVFPASATISWPLEESRVASLPLTNCQAGSGGRHQFANARGASVRKDAKAMQAGSSMSGPALCLCQNINCGSGDQVRDVVAAPLEEDAGDPAQRIIAGIPSRRPRIVSWFSCGTAS